VSAVTDFDVVVSYSEECPSGLVDPFILDLQDGGLVVTEHRREATLFGAIHWLIPTAIVVFLTERYFGTLIQEAAKEHYPVLKAALKRLVARVTGPDREIRVRAIKSSPGKAPDELEAISVCTILRSGRRLICVFEHATNASQQGVSIEALLVQLQAHFADYPADALTEAVRETETRPHRPVILRFDATSRTWRPFSPDHEA
jgi:hypothetical protein